MASNEQTDIPLNEWQTETVKQPTQVLNEQGEVEIAEREVKRRYVHVPLIPHKICEAEHHFDLVDNGRRQHGMVLVKCQRCAVGKQLVPGQHGLVDGRLEPFKR
jgi:hypothetical protein